MPVPFDPMRQRAIIRDKPGGVEWYLRQPINSATIPSVANAAVRAALAGLVADAERLARHVVMHGPTAKYQAIHPMSNGDFDFSRVHRAVALMQWFLIGQIDRDHMRKAFDLSESSFAADRAESRERFDTMGMDAHVPMAVLAGEYQRGLDFYRREDRDGAAPLIASKAKSERKVAALVAQAKLAGRERDPQIEQAIDRLIKTKLGEWLGAIAENLVVWLAVRDAYTGTTRSIVNAMADAYRFMPDVPRPAELPA